MTDASNLNFEATEKIFNRNSLNRLVEESVDFHCHGVGRFDFTDIPSIDLQEIENILASRKQRSILTLYLPKQNFESFLAMMESFYQGKLSGKYNYIQGFSLEGPLLASHGGTPEVGVWMPSKQHWKEIAACGRKGLVYTVLSPDAYFTETHLSSVPQDITWIVETLLDGGVLPAPGHFVKTDPERSAKALQSVFDVVAAWGRGATITDHLFNDMPHNFKHAWRTKEEKARRDVEIQALNLESWSLDSLDEDLGLVPAVMIRSARKGLVKICQNFDGEHVDLAIVKKAVELIGAENMVMMTDSIESKRLAGRQLYMPEGSTLLYQDQGIVAAGSQNVMNQIKNMLSIGLSDAQIKLISNTVPTEIINQHKRIVMTQSEYHYRERTIHAEADCL